MNTLIANQYGHVQGEVGGSGPVLTVAAQTPRRDSVELQTSLDSVEQQLYMLAILRAAWGTMKLRKMNIIELQDFFNAFYPRLSPKSIRLMHACLRVHLNQAKVWGMTFVSGDHARGLLAFDPL